MTALPITYPETRRVSPVVPPDPYLWMQKDKTERKAWVKGETIGLMFGAQRRPFSDDSLHTAQDKVAADYLGGFVDRERLLTELHRNRTTIWVRLSVARLETRHAPC